MDREKGSRTLAYILRGLQHADTLLEVLREHNMEEPGQRRALRVLKKTLLVTGVPPTPREMTSLLKNEWDKDGCSGLVRDASTEDVEGLFRLEVTENTWIDVRESVIRTVTANMAAAAGTGTADEVAEKVAKTADILRSLDAPKLVRDEPVKFMLSSDYVQAYIAELRNPDRPKPCYFGYPCWDHATKGMWIGDVTCLAAGTGRGKSMTLLNIAHNNAEQDKHVLIIDMERSEEVFRNRHFALVSGMYIDAMDRVDDVEGIAPILQQWQEEHRGTIAYKAMEPVRTTNVKIEQVLEAHMEKHPVDLLIVDFDQKVRPNKATEVRRHNEAEVMEGFKSTAVRYRLPLLTATQSNYEKIERCAQQDNPMPLGLGDMSECREKASPCSIFIVMYEGKKDLERHLVRTRVVKNRKGGEVGMIHLLKKRFEVAKLEETFEEVDNGGGSAELSPTANNGGNGNGRGHVFASVPSPMSPTQLAQTAAPDTARAEAEEFTLPSLPAPPVVRLPVSTTGGGLTDTMEGIFKMPMIESNGRSHGYQR